MSQLYRFGKRLRSFREKVFFEILVSKEKETQKKKIFFFPFSICLGDNKTGSSERKEKKASNGKIVSIGQDLQYAKLDKCKMSHQLKVLERKKERESARIDA